MMLRKCKRIIGGKTYNTETSTLVLSKKEEGWLNSNFVALYQSRFGAFFLHKFIEGDYFNEDSDELLPMPPEAAQSWLEEHAQETPEVIEQFFGTMPEAGHSEAKFTLRLPQNLRDRLASIAEENNQSLNAWIVRCLERCSVQEFEQ